MLFDTHVHFDGIGKMEEMSSVVDRALAAGVTGMIAVGGCEAGNNFAVQMAEKFPAHIKAAVGYDRSQAGKYCDDSAGTASLMDQMTMKLKSNPAVVAVGEIGLDFHYSPETAGRQEVLFREQLAVARDAGLPVIVHSRESDEAMLAALSEHAGLRKGANDSMGVLHCFTGNIQFARCLLDLGFYISFSGIVTFKKAEELRAVAKIVPADRILVETDAPYLAPVPFRGMRNEPAYLPNVAGVLADVRGCSVEEIAEQTFGNAKRLFGLDFF